LYWTLVGTELYTPEVWTNDKKRCKEPIYQKRKIILEQTAVSLEVNNINY
jgi:hypothetical protein